MENPCLTFATPTILAGDKSLVSLISHELAHSWSGNLVTNATWRDFWLNEGFTTYAERRIQEEIYGVARAQLEQAVEWEELADAMKGMEDRDQILAVDLCGRDPDDGCTLVPYVKGASLLRMLEARHGRERWDQFVRAYFDHFAFQSITTEQFLEYLERELPSGDLRVWVHEPGLPQVSVKRPEVGEPGRHWSTQEWLLYLKSLEKPIGPERMQALDAQWGFTQSGNSEILAQWLEMALESGFEPALAVLEEFLVRIGRRKFVKPLFESMLKRPNGREWAKTIFARAATGYHPITRATVERLLFEQEVASQH